MNSLLSPCGLVLLLSCASVQPQEQFTPTSRGALLYDTHCGTCHSEQIHWRAQRRARDWTTLRGLVRQWQDEARLQWSDQDIDAVARHLNDTIYHHPLPYAVSGGLPGEVQAMTPKADPRFGSPARLAGAFAPLAADDFAGP